MAELELEIETEKENQLINRREITLIAHHPEMETPDRNKLMSEISNLIGVSKDKVIVDKINSEFGSKKSSVTTRIYESKDDALRYEPEYKLKKNNLEGE